MPGPGSLTVTELGKDHHGRRAAVQRIAGTGPVRAGDAFLVLVNVPRELPNGARLVDVVTAGTVTCVTPARGRTRGTWTIEHTPAPGISTAWQVEDTRNGAALTLAGMVPTAEQATADAEADRLRAAVTAGDRDAIDRVSNARAALAAELADTLAEADRWEELHAPAEEWAARLRADELADAIERHPAGSDVDDAAGPVPGSFHDPRVSCCRRDAADCDCAPAGDLADLADRLQAARERADAAEARHGYTCTRVEELRAAQADAEQERRDAREELTAAIDAHAALFDL